LKPDYWSPNVVIAKTTGIDVRHCAFCGIIVIFVAAFIWSHKYSYLILGVAVAIVWAWVIVDQTCGARVFSVNILRAKFIVAEYTFSRLVEEREYELPMLLKFAVETNEKNEARIIAEFSDGGRVPLQLDYSESYYSGRVRKMNALLSEVRQRVQSS